MKRTTCKKKLCGWLQGIWKAKMKMEEWIVSEYNYDYLRSPVKTNYSADAPVKEILLNLTEICSAISGV
jgi:hypothetical protein